uniref:RING-type domain-containing protein n=1 Tax=Globodera rostochiensis TaxID=31243 RepID=A0A914GQP5_GLORO
MWNILPRGGGKKELPSLEGTRKSIELPSSLTLFPHSPLILRPHFPILLPLPPPPQLAPNFAHFPPGDVANATGPHQNKVPSKRKGPGTILCKKETNNCLCLCCCAILFRIATRRQRRRNLQRSGGIIDARKANKWEGPIGAAKVVVAETDVVVVKVNCAAPPPQMRHGIKLYQQQNPQQAIRQWRAALRQLKSVEDKFITIGYIVQAFCDSGEFEQMLYAAVEQVDLANGHQDDFMKSEALLNLARANERLADFEKAIGYAESSLELPGIDRRSPGYAHLVMALAHMGLSNFQSSLQQFEKAMKIANANADKLLELQLSLGLGNLFTLMRDLNKALVFLQNALGILQGIEANHVHAKYKSAILFQLSVILRLKGRYSEAREVCEESMDLAKSVGNKPVFARALASLADICRELGETEARETITKSWARYEQAFRLLRKLNDRLGQVTVLAQMAKSAAENKGVHYAGRCECQAIQLNRKCLEMASLIGAKHPMMECHLRLQELYVQLSDNENAEQSVQAQCSLVQEMELFCNFCGQRYGEADESLQALSCSHIFHERCLQKIFVRIGEGPTTCPKCRSRASLMENISLSSSNAPTPATESLAEFIGFPVPAADPCTSTAVATSAAQTQHPPIPVVLCERNFDASRWNSISQFPGAPSSSTTTTEMESAERRICLSTSTVSSTCSASFRRQVTGDGSSFGGRSKNGQNGRQKQQQRPPIALSTFATSTQKENAFQTEHNDKDGTVWRSEFEADNGAGSAGGGEGAEENISQPLSSLEGGAKLNHVESCRRRKKTAVPSSAKGLLAIGRERMAAISPVAEEEEREEEEEDEAKDDRRRGRKPTTTRERGVTEL